MSARSEPTGLEIAVVGLGCRYPGAATSDELWRNLRGGVESLTRFSLEELELAGELPALLRHPAYVPVRGVLDGVEEFDAAFFGFYPREAQMLDPQQRVFLELCWQALEDAGYPPSAAGVPVGVFAGAGTRDYYDTLTRDAAVAATLDPYQLAWFTEKDHLATRVSYHLGLEGPSMAVQSACSTSLVAVHVAAQSLLAGECDLALAGGVSISLPQRAGYLAMEGGILSTDGHCRAFDARSTGTVGADGAGVVVLKRLADALADGDRVRAVILGTAINNDGSRKVGFTAPSVDGQAGAMRAALAVARVPASSVTFLEAHGTGTRLGDPIEVAAIRGVYDSNGGPPCALGSIKANLGHTDAAAGVAGLIKAVLALEHRQLPPTPHFESPNPELGLERSRLWVPARLAEWPSPDGGPRRAAVSSTGIGGTNAHIVLEEAPPVAPPPPSSSGRGYHLLALSARSEAALGAARQRLAAHLEAHPGELADAAYTLHVGRVAFPHRAVAVVEDAASAQAALIGGDRQDDAAPAAETAERVVFLFPGGGAQHLDMGAELYRDEPVFRAVVDRCAELARATLGMDLRAAMFSSSGAEPRRGVDDNAVFPLALFVIEHALAELFTSWGVAPAAMLGHSLGEYVAAHRAGVFSLEDALALVALRGRIFERLPRGAMTSVPLGRAELERELRPGVSIAALNAPELTVASGRVEAVEELERRLAARGVTCKRINLEIAAHSPDLDGFADELHRFVSSRRLSAPSAPVMSNVTGTWLTARQATDPAYWAEHLRRPVQFSAGVHTLLEAGLRVFVEVGPGWALSSLVRAHRSPERNARAFPALPHPADRACSSRFALTALGKLWTAGAEIDWRRFYAGQPRRKVALPTYPFERSRYWIDTRRSNAAPPPEHQVAKAVMAAASESLAATRAPAAEESVSATERVILDVWEESFGLSGLRLSSDFFEIGGTSLLATRVLFALQERIGVKLTLAQLVRASTVRRLAELIEGGNGATSGPASGAHGVARPSSHRTASGTDAPPVGAPVADLKLGFEVPPRAPRGAAGNALLLTGATGYLGAHLLRALLRRGDAPIHCLVRAEDAEAGRRRIHEVLAEYRLVSSLGAVEGAERIIPLLGSLEQPRLGLDEEHFDRLAGELAAIYHCGAHVHFTYPYQRLAAANVGGTREVLRLAARGGLVPVHHVSTTAVTPPGAAHVTEADPLGAWDELDTGYAQSKWVAERLVEQARALGLPVAIYRPGAVTGDVRTGICRADDAIWRMLKSCVQLGIAPELDEPIPNAPASYVSDAIVHLSGELSGQPDSLGQVFHLTSPERVTWNHLFELVRGAGFSIRQVPYRQWRDALDRVRSEQENAMFPLVHAIARDAPAPGTWFDCSAAQRALAGSGIEPGSFDLDRMRRYLHSFVEAGFFTSPQSQTAKDYTL